MRGHWGRTAAVVPGCRCRTVIWWRSTRISVSFGLAYLLANKEGWVSVSAR
jgi:hypothetical protein